MSSRLIRLGASLVLAACVLLGLVASSAPAEKPASKEVYVALGDSYTSGPLVPMQYGDPIDCGRSNRNYPSLVAEALEPDVFIDVSCGSAQTKHMTEPQTGLPAGGTNPPQFDALRPDATLVTVGIGGNDAGLVGVATQCAQLGLTNPLGSACRDYYAPGGKDTVEARIEKARPRVAGVLRGIHERSPRARVAIVGYPNVLPRDGSNCYPTVPLSSDDVKYIDALIIRINKMIAEEAADNDAEFIDTYDDSIGHDVCKLPPTRWFEGVVPTEPAYPLHPNGKGLASMGKSAIEVLSGPPPPRLANLRTRSHNAGAKRKIAVRFRLNTDARVEISRSRLIRRDQVSERRPVAKVDGRAGRNVIRVRARRLGRVPGRYLLVARAAADSRVQVIARYRVRSGD